MRLAFNEDCPIFHAENAFHLHRILQTVVRGWHYLVSPTGDRLRELIGEATWSVYGVLLSKSGKTRLYAPQLDSPTDCSACDPARLAAFLDTKVIVLVENATTDGGFLRAAVAALRRGALHGALGGKDPSVQVEHGGGIGELPKEVRRHVAERPRPIDGLPPRFIVIADSDGRYPNHRSAQASAVARVAYENGVLCHVLRKRSIENYVPGDALHGYAQTRTEREPTVRLITSLPDDAWDYYPMKDGIPTGVALSVEELQLYPSAVPRDLGMGDFMADFLANFVHLLSDGELVRRDHDGDLSDLLDLLERNV